MNGQDVGYIRVSTVDQNSARQLAGVKLDRVFEDKASGKNMDRPQLDLCLKYTREGDTLHVHSMDRLARNIDDMRRIVREQTGRGVVVKFHKENLTFSGEDSPMSHLLLSMLGAVAQFERDLIRERQKEGIAIAKAAGKYKGRKPVLTPDELAKAKEMIGLGIPVARVARNFDIGRTTLYRHIGGNQNGN